MSWQIALALTILIGIIRVLFTRSFAQKSKAPTTIPPAASYLFGVLPVGLFAGLVVFPHHIEWSWIMLVLMVILSISMALSNWLGFIAAGKIGVAPQQTIGMLTNICVVILGWTILGEGLNTPQFVGGGILLVASFLAIFAPAKTKVGDFKRLSYGTIFIAVTAAVLLAIGLVVEKMLLEHMEIGGIFLVSWPVQTLGMLILAGKDISMKSLRAFRGKELLTSTLIGISNGLNGVFYIYTIFHSDNISLVTVIGTIGFPLTILGAYIFLHEREHHRIMWLSLGIALVGLIVMSL